MVIFVLTLNCFTNTSVIYIFQTQQLQIGGIFNSGLSSVDKQACDVFTNETIKVQVQIGDIIFQSGYQMYNPKELSLFLGKISGNLLKINQFSVALFTITSKNDNIYQSGTSMNFITRVFDRQNCFKNINLYYNTATDQIILQRIPQITCNFKADGEVESTVFVKVDSKLTILLTDKLGSQYTDWFSRNTSCSSSFCAQHIEDFLFIIFPFGFYNVNIPQKFTKQTNAYSSDGTIVQQDTDFNLNLTIRQVIAEFTSEELIPEIISNRIRPLYQTIEIYQNIRPGLKEIYTEFSEFLINICIGSSNSNSSESYCFAYLSDTFITNESITYRCDQQTETSYEECVDNLFAISKFTDSQIGIVYYDMYRDDDTMESFKYYSSVIQNRYTPILLSYTDQYICAQFQTREGFIVQQETMEFVLQWTTLDSSQILTNVFKFPNDQGYYCFTASFQELRSIMQVNKMDFILQISDQILYINEVQDLTRPIAFVHGILTMIILAIVLGGGLTVIMVFDTKTRK
ncbi:hypothetical protein SS50377_21773 [Spironucleus salmonicida]|uniref:Transmembrane protein n=1 Tax=Spironucleus salmonicida TaxID=348837 RepID=V6LRK6_9EUKA|nr:hypothetical protein SS50377_21773 [Spironucleus salmonicida]|eukprot:EST43419.1 Hypothetical protein SS50377_16880 [Spironucleus salmonicida]